MTTMLTADRVRAETPAGDPRRAMLALARFEAVRLLRHPVTIAGLLLFGAAEAYGWVSGANGYPVLQEEDWSKQFLAMLVLGGAALIAVNLAALRSSRQATDALFDTLVLPDPWRTGGFLLSVLPFGGVVAVLVTVRIGALAAVPGAAGRPNLFELALYPASVLLLGAAGVLLAQLSRAVIVAPLLLLVLPVLTLAAALRTLPGGSRTGWLLPVSFDEPPMPMPVVLMARPAGWHLAYVAGLIVLVATAALAVARAGERRRLASTAGNRPAGAGPVRPAAGAGEPRPSAVGAGEPRPSAVGAGEPRPSAVGAGRRRLLVAGATGLTIAVLAGTAQFLPMSDEVRAARATAAEHPARLQTCRQIDQVAYCAFGGFGSWIEGWDTVVRGVLRGVPDDQARQPLAVRQRVSTETRLVDGRSWSAEEQAADVAAWRKVDAGAGTPNAVTVGTRWGDPLSEVAFAGLVAYEVVVRGGAQADGRRAEAASGQLCGARGVLAAWLAGQATPRATEGLHEADATSSGGVTFGDPEFPVAMSVPDREMAVALAMLKRPAGEVAGVIRQSWAEWVAKGTPTERAGELAGVPVPPQPPAEERTVCE